MAGVGPQLRTKPALAAFLENQIRGRSPAIVRLREQVLEFAVSPSARGALIVGPIGAGKSTLARLLAFTRRVAFLEPENADELLRNVRIDSSGRIDLRAALLPWFRELSLPGLVESLAARQLFGSVRGAFTGADEDAKGVFDSVKDEKDGGYKATGGVVFLDEIGDLTQSLQALLLPVLDAAPFYRVGEEGKSDSARTYQGVVIAATWRDPGDGSIRPDIVSRLSRYTITVPTLDERKDDIEEIVRHLAARASSSHFAAIKALVARGAIDLDRDHLLSDGDPPHAFTVDDIRRLRDVTWSRLGNMRGLQKIVDAVVIDGLAVSAAIARAPIVAVEPLSRGEFDPLKQVQRLTAPGQPRTGLAGRLGELEAQDRRKLADFIEADRAASENLASSLGTTPQAVKKQARELRRIRRKAHGGSS